jgi:hypothetical protein
MIAPALEQQHEVVGAPRVSGLGFGSRMRDTEAGRAKIATAIGRYMEWCEQTGTPFSCHSGNEISEIEVGEPVGSGM